MLTKEEQIIQNLYDKKAKDDENSRDLAQLIKSLVTEILSGEKYINELLQNADDQESPAVQFVLAGEYLIYKHQGKHFDEEDVIGISKCANAENRKRSDPNKTGNKGIGFKAVFSMASKVTIISKGYCFSFDEHHTKWKDNPTHYPWPIIPILTDKEEYPEAVKEHYDDTSVHFIFRVRPSILPEIHKHLQKLNSNKLLFLRHTKKIEISVGSEATTVVELQPPTTVFNRPKDLFEIKEIKISDQSSWLVYKVDCAVPTALQNQFAAAEDIPEKYKKCKTIPIALAIRCKKDQLVLMPSDTRVFCYLPTDLDFGLNCIVNAEFLLEGSRMQLRSGAIGEAWNGFILESIFRESVQFSSILSTRSPYWASVIDALAPASCIPQQFNLFRNRCQSAFDAAIEKFPLVKNLKQTKEFTIKNTVLDLNGFISKFGNDPLQQNCAHPEVRNKELLHKLGAQYLLTTTIIQTMSSAWLLANIKTPQKNREFIELLKVLYNNAGPKTQEALSAAFKSGTLIVSERKQLTKASDIYFPDERLKQVVGGYAFLNIVHEEMEHSTAKDWLSAMGVGKLSLVQIIEKANLAKEELVQFTLHVAVKGNLFSDSKTKKTEIEQVKLLKVKNAEGTIVSASECYLPDCFDPDNKIQRFVGEASIFLHQDYLPDPSNSSTYKAFLLHMGVNQSIDLNNLPKIVKAVNDTKDPAKIIKFTKWVFKNFYIKQEIEEQKKLLQIIKSLSVVSANKTCTRATFCYLPDKYKPAQSLEAIVPSPSRQISIEYCEDDASIQQWHDFFVALGAREKLNLNVFQTPYISPNNRESLKDKDPLSVLYLEYLHKQKQKSKEQLYPSATTSFMHQHYFEGAYVKIDFIQDIFSTPYFWKLLHAHWDKFGELIANVSYVTARSKEPVPSNIHYWVEQAIHKQYGEETSPSDFFSNAMRENLGEYAHVCHLDIAEITEGITQEQAAILGFKLQLSLEDCLAVLAEIANAGQYHDDMNKIIFIYQQLLYHHNSSSETEALAGIATGSILLPNQHGTFVPSTQLIYVEDDALPHSENDCLIKKPVALKAKEFKKLCHFLGVQIVNSASFTIRVANEQMKSPLMTSFNEKLHFILSIEAYTRDWVGVSNAQLRGSLATTIRDKLSKITCVCALELQVAYADKIDDRIELWIDANKLQIFHNPHDKLEHQEQQRLYSFFHKYFELTCTLDDFLSIMTSSIEQIHNRYKKRLVGFDATSFSGAAQTIQQHPQDETVAAVSEDVPMPINSNAHETAKPTTNNTQNYSNQAARDGASGGTYKRKENPTEDDNPADKKKVQLTGQSSETPRGLFFSEGYTRVQRYEIGYRGEEAVYNRWKDKHTKKYGTDNITETEKGYTINRGAKGIKAIKWMNKRPEGLTIEESNIHTHESHKPYDFETKVTLDGQETTRHFEVKTTTKQNAAVEFSCSAAEWQQIINDNGRHRLFFVRATVTDGAVNVDPNNIKKKDLIQEQEQGHAAVTDFKRITLK